jgi:hypothetical protein
MTVILLFLSNGYSQANLANLSMASKYQTTKLKYSPESSLANFAIHTFGKLGKFSAIMAIF